MLLYPSKFEPVQTLIITLDERIMPIQFSNILPIHFYFNLEFLVHDLNAAEKSLSFVIWTQCCPARFFLYLKLKTLKIDVRFSANLFHFMVRLG